MCWAWGVRGWLAVMVWPARWMLAVWISLSGSSRVVWRVCSHAAAVAGVVV